MNERLGFLRDKSNKLSLSPGVYLMKDSTGKVIYVGKAKALKNRVTISVWRVIVYLLFLLFFCCFGCQRGEKPAVTGFFPATGSATG